MNHWLVKTEPEAYSWDDLVRKKQDMWDGVRNYGARNNLRAMKKGDLVLFYHSNKGKEIVGIAKVAKEHYQEPTTTDDRWCVVDLIPFEKLPKPVSLEDIKADVSLQHLPLVKQGRLSVQPIPADAFDKILQMSYDKA
jgi:predicted RNA-binding protein with PUA-like domain